MLKVKLKVQELLHALQDAAVHAQNMMSLGLIPLFEKLSGEEAFFSRGQRRLREEIEATRQAIEDMGVANAAAEAIANMSGAAAAGVGPMQAWRNAILDAARSEE